MHLSRYLNTKPKVIGTLYPAPCPLYAVLMARGWESKSVEEQMEQQRTTEPAKDGRPAAGQADAQATRERERQALELQRERILDERTSSPIRRKALQAALDEIEAKLKAL
jgi:hypothetical protein